MFKIVKPLQSEKGMTLLEVMMAIALLGIFLTTCAHVYSFVSRYDADTLEQLCMAELADAQMESIKADPVKFLDDTKLIAATTPDGRTYTVLFEKPVENQEMRKITVGPEGSGPAELQDSFSPSNYVLVGWIPPQVTPNVVAPSGEVPAEQLYNKGNWGNPNKWVFDQDSGKIYKDGVGNSPESIYYKDSFDTFSYITYIKFDKLAPRNSEDGIGITFKTDTDVYNCYMYNGWTNENKVDEFWLNFTKNGIDEKDFPRDTNIPIVYTNFYFKAQCQDGILTLELGISNESGALQPITTLEEYHLEAPVKLGLHDSTTGSIDSVFLIDSISGGGGGEDCKL